jgi:3-dehydroquinate synthase
MPRFPVVTPQRSYDAIIERGLISRASGYVPASAGIVFVVTTEDVWKLFGAALESALRGRSFKVLFFPGGEERKRLSEVEKLAEQMVEAGGDRTSLVIAFGGGIVNDIGGFLASAFMRGIPLVQIPTTLLAQVDAAVGGKTGVNLVSGKNLFGAFHQPLAVLIDPDALATLSDREYRAGLYEVIKCGVIRDPELFRLLESRHDDVLARGPEVVDRIIAAAVRIKAEVVSADEREGDLRRILNFGHTVGHALEAETAYSRFLHGEAVAFGMKAATLLARGAAELPDADCSRILDVIDDYGPIPALDGIAVDRLLARLQSDKKTLKGKVHFVLPERIGAVRVVSGVPDNEIRSAIEEALTGLWGRMSSCAAVVNRRRPINNRPQLNKLPHIGH